jgi:TRAP transporter 4TM/12TM fusion protein
MMAAIVPALLYYLSIYTGVHIEAVKQGLRGLPEEEIPEAWGVLKRGFHFLLPIATLVYLLLAGYTAFRAVFMAIVVLVAVVMLRRETRIGPREFGRAMALGARNAIPVAAACAAAGIVVGVLDITGLGIKFVSLILFLSGGIFPLALILLMAAVIVLGMGMPTTPAYILAALVGAPVLIEMGTDRLAAHMFVFGGAILSSITPPVALAAYAAAAIAGANPMRVGWIACRLGFPKFLVPFLYVYNPVLLMQGSPLQALQALLTASLGVFAFSFAADGWLWRTLRPLHRLAFGVAGALLIVPEFYTDLVGLACFGAAFVPCWRGRPAAARRAAIGVSVGGADGGR